MVRGMLSLVGFYLYEREYKGSLPSPIRGLCMSKRAILVCLDDCGPDYLRLSRAPFLKRLGAEGCFVEGYSMIPSVTNVNVVSILTGKYPKEHGITTNYYYEPEMGREVYMESPEFIKTCTLLEWGMGRG